MPSGDPQGEHRVGYRRVTVDGADYFLPDFAADRPAVKPLLQGRFYEPLTHALVAHLFRSNPGSMIHAGAFFGDMLPSFARAVPGRVHAFEPVLESYVLARLCVEANGLDNVILFNAALSSEVRTLRIDTGPGRKRHAGGTSRIGAEGRICNALTIDMLGLSDVVLIQLDVEGHERTALLGARETIRINRPVIAVEDNNRDCGTLLAEAGYRHAGDIPELSLWVPGDREALARQVEAFLAGTDGLG